MSGLLPSGDYWDLNKAYLENKHGFNILYLTYEELSRDKIECIKKISEFLGYNNISVEQLETVDKATTFEAMHADKGEKVVKYQLKGKPGRNKAMLSGMERLRIAEQTKIKFAGMDAEIPSSYFTD